MKKTILSGLLSLAMLGSLITIPTGASAAEDYSDHATWEVTAQNRVKQAHGYHLGNTYGTGSGPKHPYEQVSDGWPSYIYDESKLTNGGVGLNGTQNAKHCAGFGNSQTMINKYYNWTDYKANTDYVVSIDLRNLSEGDITPTFYAAMLSYDNTTGKFVKAQYEKFAVSEKGSAGQKFTKTFTTGDVVSVGMTGVYFGFGTGETVCGVTTEKTATGSIVGAKADNLYIGEEQVKEIVFETEEDTTIERGNAIVVKAQVLNQVGDTGLLDQTVSFKVLNDDRTEEISDSGIEVTPASDGEYVISVANTVKAGDYVILAKSALSTEDKLLQKGLGIKVVIPELISWEDNAKIAEEDINPNRFVSPAASGHFTNRNSNYATIGVSGRWATYTITTENNNQKYWCAEGTYFSKWGDGSALNWNSWEGNANYVYSFELKNMSAEGITPRFTYAQWSKNASDKRVVDYENFEVTSREGQVYTATLSTDVAGSAGSIGFPDGVKWGTKPNPLSPEGSVVYLNMDNAYVGIEQAAEITNAVEEAEIPAGETGKGKVEILNQCGGKGKFSQDVQFKITDVERTGELKNTGIKVIPGENGEYTYSVSAETTPGEYVILARSKYLAGEIKLQKGATIKVTKPIIKDSEPISSTLHEVKVDIKGEGDAEMGLFDEIILKAQMVDNSGNVGSNAQAFSWIATNEKRTEEEPKINVEVSNDTTEATITLAPSIESGKYYIIAESTAEESKGMRKGFAITVDKSGAVKEIADGFKVDTSENITKLEENFDTYLEVLKLDDAEGVSKKADKKDLVALIVASTEGETLETEADVQKYIEKLAVVSLYNKNENGATLSDNKGNFNFAEELALKDIDKDGVTLYNLYTKVMSDEGRKAMQKVLEKPETPYASYDAFIDAVKENALIYAIAYPENLGTGYMEDVLTDENILAAGFSGGEYTGLSDKEDANYEMARKLYTKDQLQYALNNAEDFGGSEGGSTGGGGFSGIPSTGSKPAQDYTDIIKDLTGEGATAGAGIFADVPTSHWAYGDIYFLKDLGAISGVSATQFNPEGNVTREQFLKIVIDALKISPKSTDIEFKDVVPGAWYESYVKTGIATGIVNGMSADKFGVGMPITRQDVCVILTRAMNLSTENVAALTFADSDTVSEYANPSVSVLVEYAIINGFTDNTFKPQNTCTRAQSARIISNAVGIMNAVENN